jgi:hypothetical protein
VQHRRAQLEALSLDLKATFPSSLFLPSRIIMVRITSYERWYADPDRDAYPQGYGELFAPFDAHNAPVGPAELLTEVSTSEDTYLAFVQLDSEGFVRVYHRLRRMDPIMGGPQDAYSGKIIAIVGDVSPMGVVFCSIPANAFHRTPVIDRVATATTIGILAQQHHSGQVDLAAHRNFELAQLDAPARSRLWMLIPPCFVSEVLRASTQPEGLNPRDLWVNVVAPMLQEEDPTQVTIEPFVEWCRLAYAGGVGGANPLASSAPPPLHFGGRLEQNRRRSLAQDLPERFGATRSETTPMVAPVAASAATTTPLVALAPESLAPLVQVLQTYNQEHFARIDAATARESERRTQDEDRRNQEKVKHPSTRWGKTLAPLLKLCGVADEVFLPDVWQDLATHGSKSDRRTLQYHMDLEYPRLGDSGKIGALVGISAALAQDLVNFRFLGPTPDYIGTGLSIFMVSYPTTEAIAALRDSVALYDQQVDNDQSVTVKDADRIRDEQKFRYPTTYAGTKEVLRAYHRLLYVVLGEQHPITVAFGPFVRRFEEKEPVYSKSLNDLRRCAGLLKFVQTTVHHAVDAHFRNQSQPPLDFMSVYTKIDYDDWSPQSVPHVPAAQGATSTQPTLAPTESSGASPKPPRHPADSAHLDRGAIPVISRFSPTQYIKKHGQPPYNEDNVRMCLSYHVVGFCPPGCTRATDHRKHTAQETALLVTYLGPALKGLKEKGT